MKILHISIAMTSLLLFIGCGAKNPTKLQNNKNLGINNSLLEQRYSFIPKDEFLTNTNWAYQIEAIPSGEYLLSNEQMVKTFLLAHNASRIVIIGNENEIEKYKKYFKENGVTAEIYLQPVETNNKEFVNLLFFNKKDKK